MDVWLLAPDAPAAADARMLSYCERLLSSDERDRRDRFHFQRHRHQFLVSHALVRTTLSRYSHVEPERWEFSTNAHGRPEIAVPCQSPPLRFNLSHTDGLIACAVALAVDVGVDVEDATRSTAVAAIARRSFSPAEVNALEALPGARQTDRFFSLWTLKEAYIKARGLGLALPLDAFTMLVDRGDAPSIQFSAAIADDPGAWGFHASAPTARHRLAVAVRSEGLPACFEVRWLASLGET
ncbi:MAG: 4'-phosphopantetheinyl transferase superfamily protein [Candidatus Schekmanbacteria bacterium]|nr:4'-phosphopantetheinyl transferase superfamily protein [Candidatus Schekmanbacteria bacterium]